MVKTKSNKLFEVGWTPAILVGGFIVVTSLPFLYYFLSQL